ncbi:TonB-dependent receptor [Sphingomonas carotinifaciens]|uniref:Iron complex outermembrane recepter protein n=1 Tax=Sphingomonas carotinifaciens TaxID=1166323 RepID=A0A1G7FEN3_9SPHN|nr:TonB-dependent receptor [Sphingomonas carotinifaciens]MBB4086015.1 iron complex outermembrane receptor protein [Sphingomonas carotinifaciens]MWC45400.1 TonB-dependent receptor [Sphingomonas carotinifaciens]SDE74317.1 iron complex outermembrane recepter protein [Sphingomonas carotinifaciens]
MTSWIKRAALLGSALGVLAIVPAAAQTADTATSAADTQPAAEGLEDITVTAERRSESLNRVPVSVAVVGGADLRSFQTGGEDILALSGRVPGLYAETTTGRIFPRFYIRGLGNIDFYLGASQPVSVIQDDVVLEHVVLKSNPAFDVAQVEVLRGPQGSLFGRNTTAGIIKIDTIKPTQTFQSRATASIGSYNTMHLDAGVGGPIIKDVLAFRVSALIQHRDDWIDNTYAGPSLDGTLTPRENAMGGFTERDVRLQLAFTPTDRLSFDLSGHARWYDGTSTVFHRAALKRGSNDVSGEPRDRIALDEGRDNPQSYETQGASLRANWDMGAASLTSITAYERTSGFSAGDTDGGAAANFPVNGVANGYGLSLGRVRDLDQWTQEVRLASNGTGPFRWQVGGIYFDSRDTTDFYQRRFLLLPAYNPLQPGNPNTNNPDNWVRLRNTNTSWGVFGQVSYEVVPDLTITAGGRISEDSKRTRLVKAPGRPDGGVVYRGRTDVSLSDTQPSWDLSALYQVNPDLSVYVRAARGFRGPTIQGRSAVFNSDFTTADSEKNLSFETGFKSNLFGNTLRLNASAFAYRVSDIQLNGNDADGNGVLFNADKAVAYGLEADAQWLPVRNLALSAGVSLLHSEIRDSRVYAQVCALNGQVVCTVQDPTITRTIFGAPAVLAQIDGNPLPNAPEYNVNLAARYDVPLADDSKVFISTDWNIQGFTNFVLYKTKEFNANGNFEGGLQVGYAAPNDDWQIAVFARNITNEKNLKGVIENYMAAVFNEPRIIGVTLSGKFR